MFSQLWKKWNFLYFLKNCSYIYSKTGGRWWLNIANQLIKRSYKRQKVSKSHQITPWYNRQCQRNFHCWKMFFFKKNEPFPASFSLFSSYQYTVDIKLMFDINKFLPMTGFEPWTSGIGSDRSTNWASTTSKMFFLSRYSPYETAELDGSGDPTVLSPFRAFRHCMWFSVASWVQQGSDFVPRLKPYLYNSTVSNHIHPTLYDPINPIGKLFPCMVNK